MTAYPLADPGLVDALGAALRAADFSSDGIDGLLGEQAGAALVGGTWWPALRATRRAPVQKQALATLIRLFLLGSTEPETDVAAAFGGLAVDDLVDGGVLARDDHGVRALLDIRPHGSDDADYLVVADQDASMRSGAVAHDHVLGIGGASMSLAQAVIRTPAARALDLGTGCGVQALHMNGHCGEIVATDTNPRALALAAATARLNQMNWDLRDGSLFEPVAGQTFDLIVSNPPFVVGTGAQDYIYRDSGIVGDGVSRHLIENARTHLNPGGIAQILANWVVYDEENWDEGIRTWVDASGLDAWVVQRELADPITYVSLWVSDAGESPVEAARRGADWLDWFEREGIVGVGMGSVTLRRPVEDRPADVVIEEITAAGQEVTGFEAQAWFNRRDFLRATSDADLLAARLRTAPVFLEFQSLPGDDGWQQVGASVTRPGGPGAVLGVDEVLTALIAGCRGEVPLGALITLLADFHGVDADALAEAAMPSVREAIGRGILFVVE
ncbi:DUF7782 domain-containing protein [Gordonia liuliyuniae]|uniref:Methyltransferase n=1 Tax=Gordonia liuliyuniae TaxID=2911517 RepID=A0ABS9IS39_9ACTN|nr:methyltransferase [Gordonia liuliyuniae]MCF8588381.1 methyltransferase [Gordonia liuliyuniae]